MEPTPAPKDRILVNKIGGAPSLQRGDLVVFDDTRTFADRAARPGSGRSSVVGTIMGSVVSTLSLRLNESDFVKRVVRLSRDHVVCCDSGGLLTVNGSAVQEPGLYPGDKPGGLTFDVTVPAGGDVVMGDHRSDSADPRAHLADPGAAMVQRPILIGRAGLISWPTGRVGVLYALPSPAPGSSAGAAGDR